MSNVPKRREVDRREVGDHRLDPALEHAVREVEPARPGRSARQKSVVSRDWSGSTPRSRHSFQYCDARGEVDAPGVVIERDDARRAAPLGEERVVAVPRADIEHRAAAEVGELRLGHHLGHHRLALGDDAVAEIDRVVPGERIDLRLELRRIDHGDGQ